MIALIAAVCSIVLPGMTAIDSTIRAEYATDAGKNAI